MAPTRANCSHAHAQPALAQPRERRAQVAAARRLIWQLHVRLATQLLGAHRAQHQTGAATRDAGRKEQTALGAKNLLFGNLIRKKKFFGKKLFVRSK